MLNHRNQRLPTWNKKNCPTLALVFPGWKPWVEYRAEMCFHLCGAVNKRTASVVVCCGRIRGHELESDAY